MATIEEVATSHVFTVFHVLPERTQRFPQIFQCSLRLAKMQQASTNKPRESGTSGLVASTHVVSYMEEC